MSSELDPPPAEPDTRSGRGAQAVTAEAVGLVGVGYLLAGLVAATWSPVLAVATTFGNHNNRYCSFRWPWWSPSPSPAGCLLGVAPPRAGPGPRGAGPRRGGGLAHDHPRLSARPPRCFAGGRGLVRGNQHLALPQQRRVERHRHPGSGVTRTSGDFDRGRTRGGTSVPSRPRSASATGARSDFGRARRWVTGRAGAGARRCGRPRGLPRCGRRAARLGRRAHRAPPAHNRRAAGRFGFQPAPKLRVTRWPRRVGCRSRR